jgi:hypothetical protein
MGISGNGYCSHTEYQHQNCIGVKVNHHDLVLRLMLFLFGPLIYAYIAHDIAALMYLPHMLSFVTLEQAPSEKCPVWIPESMKLIQPTPLGHVAQHTSN